MLKRLRVKFVCINMVIVTAMLCVIFGLVIHFTSSALETQSIQMMQSIAEDPMSIGRPGESQEQVLLPYFVVQISLRGEMTVISSSYFDLSDEELVRTIVRSASGSQEQIGILKEHSLRYYISASMMGQTIVFADLSSERATTENLVRTCLFIGALSLVLFWLLSLLLARWAVKPVDRAWQQQKQFVADASHELKTPLTVIMTNAELLQNPEYPEEDRARFSESILTMSHQMRRLVENLLDQAKVDNGAVQTAFTDIDLTTLASDSVLPFEPLYFEKGLLLRTQLQENVHVRGSTQHLSQVLEILLDNAMKYSAPQGLIWVTLKRQGSHAFLAVSNPGPPIEEEDLRNIFKRFYRVDKARSRDGSYGLGLSIAESIVQAHRGRIWAESKEGINTFVFQLPAL